MLILVLNGLMEERAQKAKEASEKPKSFFEKIKALLTKPL